MPTTGLSDTFSFMFICLLSKPFVTMKKINTRDLYPSVFACLCFYFLLKSVNCASKNNSLDPSYDKISLNCGSTESLSFNGIYWTGDLGSKFMPQDYESKAISVVSKQANNIPRIPYLTARVSRSPFLYSFPITPGVKFIRFHFHPASYSGLDLISKAYFSVTIGHYTLLDNFSPSVIADTLHMTYFTKEYAVDVKQHTLNVTFIPSVNTRDAFAFINGIEIQSMAFMPYNYAANATSTPFLINHEHAFEMLYRVTIYGGDDSYILGFIDGKVIRTDENITYNSWITSDYGESYYSMARVMGNGDAVNMKNNLTWAFSIDSGFEYLVRLHFCEISIDVTEMNQRVFSISINNMMVEKSLDLVALAGKPLVAIYRDYFIKVPKGTGERQDVRVDLHPNTDSKPTFADAILNGIEIIKISDRSGNLAAFVQLEIERRRKKFTSSIIISGVSGGIVSLILLSFIARWWVKGKRVSAGILPVHRSGYGNTKAPLVITSDCCRRFALAEIRAATNNFSEAYVVGKGGFGKVYKGLIDGGVTQVAIKRKSPESHQGIQEFKNEIELLSTFHHRNLVSLLGFCQEDNELLLVYDFIAGGTLRDHLYKTQNPPLSWSKRLKICIDASRGLHYLHTGTKHTIIHRDIKSTNILLDQEWVAKVSDFGLSRICTTSTSHGHVSTEVKGTFGYLDPIYYRSRKLTEKSDVYSFGVVLLEVLCARPAVNPMVKEENEKISLAEWALVSHQNGTIDHMVDPYLRGKIAPECQNKFVNIAIKCLGDKRTERPSMGDVLGNLEKALQLQEAAEARAIEDEQRMTMEH